MFFLCFADVAECNITLNVTDTKQYFATEGYPYNYKNDQDCTFNFEAPSGRRIVVFFEDFNLELYYDFLHFRKLSIQAFYDKDIWFIFLQIIWQIKCDTEQNKLHQKCAQWGMNQQPLGDF